MTEASPIQRHDVEPVNKKEHRSLYESRVKIHPKRVTGFYRNLKWWIMIVTLSIYYFTPWLRWDRGPFAPDQAVLLDLAQRRFYFFSIEIWPQEFFYVAGMLIMAGIGLFLVTSVWGRAWCGYACPQTVWVDLFLYVERFVEGDRNARLKLDKAPMTFEKIRKRSLKHIIYLAISVATGGAWIFYFADAPTLLRDFVTLNAAPVAYSTVALLTATTYVLGGLLREQVCTYMCPWPRIQAAMLDENSLVVTYNEFRGEPRGKLQKQPKPGELLHGDCIDCNSCVVVCPMGIDIRDGQQMECITCALCIDACDNVMEKINKPKGLISYSTLNEFKKVAEGAKPKNNWQLAFRPRTFIYSGIWIFIGLAMLFTLLTRDRLDINVLHDRNPLFVRLSDGGIRNGFTIKILNMEPIKKTVTLRLDGLDGGKIKIAGMKVPAAVEHEVKIEPDKLRQLRVLVAVPKDKVPPQNQHFKFLIKAQETGETSNYTAKFHVKRK